MVEKKEIKTEKIEREYTIPLREKCRPVPRYKKTPKSVKTIKEFLVRHMKIRDKDLKKIKIDIHLNEQLWIRGIKKPFHKIKVKVVREGDIVRVYSAELPAKIEFKKKRMEKHEQSQAEFVENKKSMMQKAKESMKSNQQTNDKSQSKETIQNKEEKTTETTEEKKGENKEDNKEKKMPQKAPKEAPQKQKPVKQQIQKPAKKTTPQRKTMPQ
ncbi:MAG: 50S ribosomal protein L31e [Nanoarchaeota archaeon]|nr:50S ribosomal protein L31e [Nanoarchaeota archaeon]